LLKFNIALDSFTIVIEGPAYKIEHSPKSQPITFSPSPRGEKPPEANSPDSPGNREDYKRNEHFMASKHICSISSLMIFYNYFDLVTFFIFFTLKNRIIRASGPLNMIPGRA